MWKGQEGIKLLGSVEFIQVTIIMISVKYIIYNTIHNISPQPTLLI